MDVGPNAVFQENKKKMAKRGEVHEGGEGVVCPGGFYDFRKKRDGRWGFVLRQPIYEKDRMDPVDPAAKLALDAELLASFSEGYRHLAYLQSQIGYKIKPDMPGLKGEAVERLYLSRAAWLRGERQSRYLCPFAPFR